MSKLNKIEKYQLFCLEMYKIKRNITGKVALEEFETYDVFSFIRAGYEVLHTQAALEKLSFSNIITIE